MYILQLTMLYNPMHPTKVGLIFNIFLKILDSHILLTVTISFLVLFFSVLLHIKVEEFSQCHALASVWLRWEDNSTKPGYSAVASLYVMKAMMKDMTVYVSSTVPTQLYPLK